VPIQAGDRVALWYVAANFDEEVFADPQRFDVGREPNPHVTFGRGGPPFCLGSFLAALEIRILLEEILARNIRFRAHGAAVRLSSNFVNASSRCPCGPCPHAERKGTMATSQLHCRRGSTPANGWRPIDSFEVRSPYSGAVVATVARAGADEARRAVDAAERAMRDPCRRGGADILERISQLLREAGRRARADESRRGRKPQRRRASRQPRGQSPWRCGSAQIVCASSSARSRRSLRDALEKCPAPPGGRGSPHRAFGGVELPAGLVRPGTSGRSPPTRRSRAT